MKELQDKVCMHDIRMQKESGLPDILHTFQTEYNPLTLYCRLIELGIHSKGARYLATRYEFLVYKQVKEQLRRLNV